MMLQSVELKPQTTGEIQGSSAPAMDHACWWSLRSLLQWSGGKNPVEKSWGSLVFQFPIYTYTFETRGRLDRYLIY